MTIIFTPRRTCVVTRSEICLSTEPLSDSLPIPLTEPCGSFSLGLFVLSPILGNTKTELWQLLRSLQIYESDGCYLIGTHTVVTAIVSIVLHLTVYFKLILIM